MLSKGLLLSWQRRCRAFGVRSTKSPFLKVFLNQKIFPWEKRLSLFYLKRADSRNIAISSLGGHSISRPTC